MLRYRTSIHDSVLYTPKTYFSIRRKRNTAHLESNLQELSNLIQKTRLITPRKKAWTTKISSVHIKTKTQKNAYFYNETSSKEITNPPLIGFEPYLENVEMTRVYRLRCRAKIRLCSSRRKEFTIKFSRKKEYDGE